MRIEDEAQVAEAEIAAFEEASQHYAVLLRQEQELEAARPAVKQLATLRLMQAENPLASQAGKKHSASSAEAVVETDPHYAAHLAEQRKTVFLKNDEFTRAQSARLRASLAITLCKSIAGVV